MRARLAAKAANAGFARAIAVAVAFAPLLLAGCGDKFTLPKETPGGNIPEKGSYAYQGSVRGMPGLTDVLLTRGTGSTVYVVYGLSTVRAFPRVFRGDGSTPPLSYTFSGLFQPIKVCQGPGDVFVLDQGDTTLGLVDTTKAPGFLRFGLSGGAPTFVLKDTSLASVSGIAADKDGNVYVSGILKAYVNDDPTDSRKRTYKYVSRITRYLAAQSYAKDLNFFVDEGQGIGTVFQPGDIYVDPGIDLSTIYVADTGKDIGQVLTYVPNNKGNPLPSVSIDAAGSGQTTLAPEDIGGDRQGFTYMADTGRHRVLRFDATGAYVQRVDIELDLDADSLHLPVAVSCDDSLVYVADHDTGKVSSYKRRK